MSDFSKLPSKFNYALSAIRKRIGGKYKNCPVCGSSASFQFKGREFRKLPTSLRYCPNCKFFYRYPTTLMEESLSYYDREYVQPGLTTDLPNKRALKQLLDKNFLGTEKDFSKWMVLFELISNRFGRKIKVIDYGANWGYTSLQIKKNSFVSDCLAYEISGLRKSFGKEKLGIEYIEEKDFDCTFDVLFSSHVVEHMYNPALINIHASSLLRPGGYAIITCPNCSLSAVPINKNWRHSWGEVHPNGITDGFFITQFIGYTGAIGNEELTASAFAEFLDSCKTRLASWLPTTPNLLAVMRKPENFGEV